jgi:hypothetical protein
MNDTNQLQQVHTQTAQPEWARSGGKTLHPDLVAKLARDYREFGDGKTTTQPEIPRVNSAINEVPTQSVVQPSSFDLSGGDLSRALNKSAAPQIQMAAASSDKTITADMLSTATKQVNTLFQGTVQPGTTYNSPEAQFNALMGNQVQRRDNLVTFADHTAQLVKGGVSPELRQTIEEGKAKAREGIRKLGETQRLTEAGQNHTGRQEVNHYRATQEILQRPDVANAINPTSDEQREVKKMTPWQYLKYLVQRAGAAVMWLKTFNERQQRMQQISAPSSEKGRTHQQLGITSTRSELSKNTQGSVG